MSAVGSTAASPAATFSQRLSSEKSSGKSSGKTCRLPYRLAVFALFVLTLCVTPSALAQSGCYAANFGAVGLPFDSGTPAVAGGTPPFVYSAVGTLPAGLALNTATGEVAGTPTGTGAFSVRSTDALGATGNAQCTITIGSLANPASALGLVNAYNLIALTGDISDGADITGRIAAAGQVSQATTVGSDLRTSDPYISLASANGGPYAIVAVGGIPTGNSFNVNAGGSVYSFTSTSAGFNFANESYMGSPYAGSTLITGGSSPINFASLTSSMSSLSTQLAGLNAYGVVCSVNNSGAIIATGGCPANPTYFNAGSQHYSPSWVVLYGTSSSVNVFNLTAAQLQNSNANLDIEVPTGSTVIVNVSGSAATLPIGVYFQGSQVTDANAASIFFNFPTATSVAINGQFDGVILAPHAWLSGSSQMGGVFIAASIGWTGEVHYVPFTGWLPWSNNSPMLSITCAAVSTGVVGVYFDSGPMAATGGTAPYVYSIVVTLPGGLALNTATGEVTGTATSAGTFQVSVTDAHGLTGTACAITINVPVSIACPANNTGTVGVYYNSGPMAVSGGTAPFTYSIAGTLPAGLTLNISTGAITGTPTAAGTFAVKVTDASGYSSTSCTITIQPAPLSMTCPATNTGTVGVFYNSGAMSVTGGTAPYKFSIMGTLPTGLSLNTTTGAVSGTPTSSGTFWVVVTDANGNTTMTCDMTIQPATLTMTCPANNTGTVGVFYNSGPMSVTGGTAPYKFSIMGTLPWGLSLNTTTGAVSGTPTSSGTFWVVVTDANGNTTMTCDMTIQPAPLTMTCPANNTGTVGVFYNSGPMSVSGGTAPYKFSIMGTLPWGLSLNTTTGAVSGTPTSSGTFWVVVTDANGNTTMTCDLTIQPAPLSLVWPTSAGTVGVAFNSGPTSVTGGTAPYTYSVSGALPSGLTLNTSTGAITGTPSAAGTFSVKVTDALGNTATSASITIMIAPGYSLSVNPSNLTVTAGQSTSTNFTFTPYGGYAGTVSFTCSGLPGGATCTFAPASLTANGSNSVQSSSLTITTSASGTVNIAANRAATGLTLATIFLPGLIFGGFFAWRRRRLSSRLGGVLLLLLAGMVLVGGAVGCGSNTGTYQNNVGSHLVTVVAKSAVAGATGPTETASFTLTVVE